MGAGGEADARGRARLDARYPLPHLDPDALGTSGAFVAGWGPPTSGWWPHFLDCDPGRLPQMSRDRGAIVMERRHLP